MLRRTFKMLLLLISFFSCFRSPPFPGGSPGETAGTAAMSDLESSATDITMIAFHRIEGITWMQLKT